MDETRLSPGGYIVVVLNTKARGTVWRSDVIPCECSRMFGGRSRSAKRTKSILLLLFFFFFFLLSFFLFLLLLLLLLFNGLD